MAKGGGKGIAIWRGVAGPAARGQHHSVPKERAPDRLHPKALLLGPEGQHPRPCLQGCAKARKLGKKDDEGIPGALGLGKDPAVGLAHKGRPRAVKKRMRSWLEKA